MRFLPLVVVLLFASNAFPQSESSNDDFAFAAGLHDRGLHERAVTAFESFLKRWPKDARAGKARFHLGQSHAALGQDEAALAQFEAYIATRESDLQSEAHLRAGELEHRLGRSEAAVKRLTRLLRRPDLGGLEEPSLYALAEASSASGDPKAAESAYRMLLTKYPEGSYAPSAHSALGFLLFAQGKVGEARTHFASAAKSSSEDEDLKLEARVLVAECALAEGNAQEAMDLAKSLQQAPGKWAPEVALLRARALLELKQPEEAVKVFRQVAKQHGEAPTLRPTLLRAAADLERQGQPRLGVGLLEQVRSNTPVESQEVAYWKGKLLLAAGQVTESLEDLRSAAQTSPRRKFGYGDALARAERHEEAAATFSELRRAEDQDLRQEATFAEAFSRSRLGDGEQAVSLLRSLSKEKLSSDLAQDVTFALAENLFGLKRYGEAALAYDRVAAVAGSPRAVPALHKRGWCAYLLKDWPALDVTFERLLSLDAGPEVQAEARYLLGKSYESRGLHEQAKEAFRKLSADASAAEFHGRSELGMAANLVRLGKEKEAEQAYRGILKGKQDAGTRAAASFGLGQLLLRTERPKEAIPVLSSLLKDHPECAEAKGGRLLRGWAYRSTKQFSEAATDAEPLLQDADRRISAEALHLHGLALYELNDYTRAVPSLQRSLAMPESEGRQMETRLVLGLALARQKNHKAAAEHFLAIANHPASIEGQDTALYELAFGYEDQGNLPSRDQCLRRLVSEFGESTFGRDAAFRLGNTLYDQEKYEAALKDYLVAAQSTDASLAAKARYKAGWAERKRSRPADAAKHFDVVAASSSELAAESLYLAAESYEEAKSFGDAHERFARMATQSPKHELAPDAACRAVLTQARLEANEEWVPAARQVLTTHGKAPRALDVALLLGHYHNTKKQWEPARAAFRRVLQGSEGEKAAEAQFGIGQAFLLEGNGDRAVDEFLRVSILYGHAPWVARATLAVAEIFSNQGDVSKARRLFLELQRDHAETPEGKRATEWLRKNGEEGK